MNAGQSSSPTALSASWELVARMRPAQGVRAASGASFLLGVRQQDRFNGGEFIIDLSCQVDTVQSVAPARLTCSAACGKGKTYAGRDWDVCGLDLDGGGSARSDRASVASAPVPLGKEFRAVAWSYTSHDPFGKGSKGLRVEADVLLFIELD